MVRLDLISSPAIYPELFEAPLKVVEGNDDEKLPQGYARIRVHGEFLEEWMGFISPTGYLRRYVKYVLSSVRIAIYGWIRRRLINVNY